jgi:DNA-binding NarL/FixJ family response regulator
MARLRVLTVDDHQLMLDAVEAALSFADDIELVGAARSGEEALELIAELRPDIVLLDMRMPQMDGLACLSAIRREHPEVKVVVLSAVDEHEQIEAALRRGAAAYVLKQIDPRDLPSALRQAAQRTVFQALEHAEAEEPTAAKAAGLTDAELRVLQALAEGRPNKQIAADLFVTEQTVKFHLTNIYRKLEVTNRTEAARFAYQHGIVSNPLFEIGA